MNTVTKLPTRKGSAPSEVTPAELQSLLGWLGLTRPWLAQRLGVYERTVIRWCDGVNTVPEKASVEMVRVWNHAADSIKVIVDVGCREAVDGLVTLRTFRVDADYHQVTKQTEYPATWHRALTCRAMDHILMRTRYQVRIEFWEASDGKD